MKTAQEVLDEGVAFILAQERRCMLGGQCAYINRTGHRDVVGNFLSENLCRVLEAERPDSSVTDIDEWITSQYRDDDFHEDVLFVREHGDLLQELQELHDAWADRTLPAPSEKVQSLAWFAELDGLQMPKHERLGDSDEDVAFMREHEDSLQKMSNFCEYCKGDRVVFHGEFVECPRCYRKEMKQ